MRIINTHADLCCYRDTGRAAHTHHPADNILEEPRLPGQGRPSSAAGDFRDRTTKIKVNMVCHIAVNDHPGCLFNDRRVNPVQLEGTELFRRRKAAQTESFRIARS